MDFSLLERARVFLQAHRRKNIWYRTMCGLAAVVVFITTYMLILPAITMERETICGIEEHQHSDDCYEVVTIDPPMVLNCTKDTLEIHVHEDGCYDSEHNLICGYADFVIHTHDKNCYDADGNLVCTLPEIKEHRHTASCYKEEHNLICTKKESEGHKHTADCYTKKKGSLICDAEEHTHIDSCKDEQGNIICGKEEHTHDDRCYEWNDVLTCTKQESEGHKHTDTCYETVKTLTCDEQEAYPHTHTDECYEGGKLVCGKLEIIEHQHTDDCWKADGEATTEKKLVCGKEEHVHGEECYKKETESAGGDAANVPMLLDDDEGSDGEGEGVGETTPTEETSEGTTGETTANAVTSVLPVTSISGTKVTYDKDADTYKANVRIEFEFPADTTITAGIPYTYTYPAGVIIPEAELNKTQILVDNSKRTAGIYQFVKNEDGSYSVQIVFNKDYVEKYCNKGEAVTGYVQFEGEFSKSSVQDNGNIVIGDGNLQINIPASDITYPDEETDTYNISAAKQGEWKKADGKLQYTVYIRTTKGTPDSIHFIDTITIPEGLGLGNPTVTVEKGSTDYHDGWYSDSSTLEEVTGVDTSYDSATGELTMTLAGLTSTKQEGYTQAGFYKITYTYPITQENWTGVIQPENTVVVSATDTTKNQTVKSEATTELYLSKDTSHTLDKYGQESGNRIKWTIIVNKNQVDIAGAKLTDEMLKTAEDMTVTPSNGYTYDKTTGTITFNAVSDGEENENQYTIVYYTPVETDFNGTTVSNSATFDPTPDQPDSDDEITVDRDVTVSGVGLNKWGNYDQTTGKINWTIEVNGNNRDIANAVLSDEAFDGLSESDITISPGSGYEYVMDGDTITGIRFLAVGDTGKNTQKYTITYSTVPETVNPGEETKVSNTANLSPGDGGEGIGKTGETSVPALTVTKGGYYTDSKINWTVTVNAGHRDIAGYELTDSMFSSLKVDEITLRYNSWSWYDDVPEGEYTIVSNSEGYVEKIVFHGANGNAVNTNQYFLSYTTAAEPAWNDREVSNDVHLKKGDINIPASSTVNVPGIKEVEKAGQLNESEDGKTTTVEWTVTIDVPSSGLPEGVVITDDVTKNSYGSTNNLQWMTWEQIIGNNFTIYWKDNNGNAISTSNPYDSSGIPGFSLKFLASDGNEYDYTEIKANKNDTFRTMTYTILTMTFADGLSLPENSTRVPTQISFSYVTTVDLEHSEIGTNHFYNCVDVDGEKADAYVDYEKPGVVKTDGNGNKETSQTSSDGEVTWKVKVKTAGNNLTKLTVTDTLPNGILPKTILVQGSGMSNVLLTVDANNTITGEGSPYHYSGTFDPETGKLTLEVTNQTEGSVLLENQEWNFTITCEADDTVFPSGNTHTLTNNVTVTTDKGSVGSDSQTQEWTHTQSTEETKVVQKTGEWDNNNRLLNYSIVLNPERKDLVAGVDTLTLIDTLRYQSTNIGGTWYEGTDGATFTIKADLVQNSVRLFKAKRENNKWVKGEEITDFSWVYATEKANDYNQTVTSTLTVSGIPDGCPLIFEYAYAVSSSAENHANEEKIKFNLPFSNEAKLEGTDHSGSSSSFTDEWKHSSSSAGVDTGHHTFTFYKVVKDNYNKALPGAVFSVYEYSKTEGKWLPEAIHTYTTDSEGKFVITFEDKDEDGVQLYKYNTLYAISETIAPDGYIKPEGYNPRYFYFSNNTAEDNMPDTHQSGTVDLSSESATSYVENTPNKTEVTVEKIWKDENGNDETSSHDGEEIQLELYQRTESSGSSQGNLTLTIDVKAGDNGDESWWSDSIGNIAEGSTVTFSVTNIWGTTSSGYNHITIEGVECTPLTKTEDYVVTETYTFTMNQNVTVGGSINWKRNEISYSSVTVTPPVNTSSGNGDSDENNDTKVADVFLSDENNWTVAITDLPLENTALDGTTENYYYYFKEVNVPEGYTVSYNNGQSCVQSGTITVTNQKNKDVVSATVNKVWKDVNNNEIEGTSESLPASVWVYLTRTVGETTERIDSEGNTGDSAQPYIVTKENNWTLTVDNLPETDDEGNVYTYSFEEVSVEGYETKVSGTGTVTITNKKKPSDTDLTVEKIWQDKDGNPVIHNSGNVTINLYQKASQGGNSGSGTGESGNLVDVTVGIKDEKENYVYVQDIQGTLGNTETSISVPTGTVITIQLYCQYGNSQYDWAQKWKESCATANGEALVRTEQDGGNIYIFQHTISENTTIDVWKNWGSEATATVTIASPVETSTVDSSESDNTDENSTVVSEGTKIKSIILNKDNEWKYTFTDLPLTGTDNDGNTVNYYYYVQEISVPNYDTSYTNNGGIQSGTITVTNKAVETPEYELPETGGPGTRIAYTLGSILMLTAAAFLYIKKKKMGEKGGLK